MTMDLIKAFLLGICVAVPVGPVLLMVFQKSVLYGHRSGWMTGLGGTICDTTWVAVSLFAISLIQDYVQAYLGGLHVIGGLLIVGIGIAIALKKVQTESVASGGDREGKPLQYMLQAMGCAFGNPGVLALMLVLVGLFRLSAASLTAPVWLVVLLVALGSCLYWWIISGLLAKFGSRLKPRTQLWISRLSGIAVAVFGLVIVIRGITLI